MLVANVADVWLKFRGFLSWCGRREARPLSCWGVLVMLIPFALLARQIDLVVALIPQAGLIDPWLEESIRGGLSAFAAFMVVSIAMPTWARFGKKLPSREHLT